MVLLTQLDSLLQLYYLLDNAFQFHIGLHCGDQPILFTLVLFYNKLNVFNPLQYFVLPVWFFVEDVYTFGVTVYQYQPAGSWKYTV